MTGYMVRFSPHTEGPPENDDEEGKKGASQAEEANGADGTDVRQLLQSHDRVRAVGSDVWY